jgi:hypothetical protein
MRDCFEPGSHSQVLGYGVYFSHLIVGRLYAAAVLSGSGQGELGEINAPL